MLIIISDLHLKDGTSGSSITPDAFNVFAARLRSMAFQASWRTDGRYLPVESIDLLLLGDVFDLIRSERWLVDASGGEEAIRPWDDFRDPAYTQKITEISSAILEYNQAGLNILRSISTGEEIYIPPANAKGEPDRRSSERVHIGVRIHYMVGNHDWFYHLPGPAYDQIRTEVIQALGLSNPPGPFPYQPEESDTIMALFEAYRVYGRHGDNFDPVNFDPEKGRDVATVGDAMTIELLTRFPYEVRRKMQDKLPLALSEGLKELSNVRPAIVTPMWVSNLILNYADDPQQAEVVKGIWDEAAQQFMQMDFVRANDRPMVFDSVDALESALLFAKGLSFDAISRLAGWVNKKLTGGDKISTAKHALQEPAFLERRAQYIVYGHTHFHEIVPLDTYFRNGQQFDQIYINAGTWHSYHDMTLQAPNKLKFVGMHVMTYLAFFKEDERSGRRFEAWSGSLSQ